MDWNKASSIAEVLSSIAILVTLFYLAVEIQQGAEATQAQTRQAILESDQQLLEMLIDDPRLHALWYTSSELTEHEKIRLSYFLILFVRMRESNWAQFTRMEPLTRKPGTPTEAQFWPSFPQRIRVRGGITSTRKEFSAMTSSLSLMTCSSKYRW